MEVKELWITDARDGVNRQGWPGGLDRQRKTRRARRGGQDGEGKPGRAGREEDRP
ncbi:hypothetical protein [Nonomuraea recticatena]|uniref:Uncharacterized protein n=1 Tax=Nonomuraea recticatena TaxID=46178 RepID=A0ABN3SMB6_9ACTN